MSTFKGLVYVKHGRVGSKSEGPDYFLQTRTTDYQLHHNEHALFKPDYELEFYCREMVEINGEAEGNILKVTSIKKIGEPRIPE